MIATSHNRCWCCESDRTKPDLSGPKHNIVGNPVLEGGVADQAITIAQRSQYMRGDYEALSIVLECEEFATIPVPRLRYSAGTLWHSGPVTYELPFASLGNRGSLPV